MAEYTTIKLNPSDHLLLEQPLLRLPYELSRNNFKIAQRHIDQTQKQVTDTFASGTKAISSSPSPATAALSTIDSALVRLNTLKRKLSQLNDSTANLNIQAKARLQHLEKLHEIPSLADVKYEEWSRIRLDRLLIDYLLRQGYVESARQLAVQKGIADLVDLEEFESCRKIERTLREGQKVDAALAWCVENKQALKKINNTLEYELRLQQFIELTRQRDGGKLLEAVMHARKHLTSPPDPVSATQAAGLLAYGPGTNVEPYRTMYSSSRWSHLAKTFLDTHHTLYSIPQKPLLDLALSAGLSALKTPACHSRFVSPSSGLNSATGMSGTANGSGASHSSKSPSSASTSTSTTARKPAESPSALQNLHGEGCVPASFTTSVCPICSTELNRLARNVPYAHHSKSHVDHDPVVLPNGRIYGRERLERLNEKLGTPLGLIRDPVDSGEVFNRSDVKKVFIS